MTGPGGAGRKLDIAKSTFVPGDAKRLWPVVSQVERWPEWLRDGRGHGLERAEALPFTPGAVDPSSPDLGRRWRLRFTNGLEGEFQATYWLEPAQISLGLVKETRREAQGIEGMIFDLDLFPQRDGRTQLWFTVLLLLERGFRPGRLARWPRRDVTRWVQGFHDRVGGLAPEAPPRRAAKAPQPPAGTT